MTSDESKPDASGVPVLIERVARRKPTTPISDLVSPKSQPPTDDVVQQPKPKPDVSQHAAPRDVPLPHSDIVGLYAGAALQGSDQRTTTQKFYDFYNNGCGGTWWGPV